MAGFTAASEALIEQAQLEAQRLGFPFVQREQLFLALLQDAAVIRILRSLGLDIESVRENVVQRLLPGLGAPADHRTIGILPTAEKVYQHQSQTAAALLGHNLIDTEHILLGFLLEKHGVVLEVLSELGVTQARMIEVITAK